MVVDRMNERMNVLISLFTGQKKPLTPKKLKQDACAVTALVLLLAVGGTVVQNTGPEDIPAASNGIDRVVSAASIADASNTKLMSSMIAREASPAVSIATLTAVTQSGTKYKTTIHLNLRSGAGTQYGIIGSGVAGTTVTATGKTSGIWYQVKMGTLTGWMSSDYLQKVVTAVPVTPVTKIAAVQYKTTIHLNLRSGPGTQYKILGAGAIGTKVNGTGKVNGIWYEVKLGTVTGWMSSEYLQDITGANTVAALQSYAGSKLGNAAQLKCLVTLWNRESNWNYRAINPAFNPSKPNTPTYQAYGIAQSAPGSKMATSGADWQTNPRTQINWGLDYIKGRYGTPCNALSHSYKVGWY